MKQIYYVIQTLIHGKGSIPFKVISLALGLGMSILLFARVAYEQSPDLLDRFFKLSGTRPNKRINVRLVKEPIDITAYRSA